MQTLQFWLSETDRCATVSSSGQLRCSSWARPVLCSFSDRSISELCFAVLVTAVFQNYLQWSALVSFLSLTHALQFPWLQYFRITCSSQLEFLSLTHALQFQWPQYFRVTFSNWISFLTSLSTSQGPLWVGNTVLNQNPFKIPDMHQTVLKSVLMRVI